MLNTHMTKEREVPLWAIGAPAIGVPLMVALLALTAPMHETPVDGADLGRYHGASRTSGGRSPLLPSRRLYRAAEQLLTPTSGICVTCRAPSAPRPSGAPKG